MKVFKIIKYHAVYSTAVKSYWSYTLCSREYIKPHTIELYTEEMDLCKICKTRVFEKMVNKLKGK